MQKGSEEIILFGTQTGTAEDLAIELQDELEQVGITLRCENIFDVDLECLIEFKRAYIIISTWGDGDPPDDAEDFCDWLGERKSSDLSGLEFSVFGLGDSGYEEFCGCAVFVDKKLENAGGVRVIDRVDCDVDISDTFAAWVNQVKAITASHSACSA